jgi:hypothetical protein
MQLSINGWHPIASHLVCIITGIALSNILSRQVRASSAPKGELSFSLSQSQAKLLKSELEDGTQANIYKILAHHTECKMFKNPLTLKKIDDRYYFATTIEEQNGLQHLVKELKLRNKVGVDRNQSKVPLCKTKPRVQYGS